jgi:O-antigen ligase
MSEAVTTRTIIALILSAVGVCAWAVGVQTFEGVASAGVGLTAAGALLSLKKGDAPQLARQWWPVGAFVGWSLLAPTIAGHPPSGSGVARTLDWLALPFAVISWQQTAPQLRAIAGKIAAGVMLVSCAVAGFQHYGVWPAEETFSAFRWTQLPFQRVYELVPGTTDRFMGGGLLFHRLKFSHVTSLGVIAAIVIAARSKPGTKGAWFAVAGLAGLSVWLFPYARMAAVAMTAAAGVTIVRASTQPRRAALVAACFCAVGSSIVWFTPAMRDRFATSFTAQGSGDRIELLETGWRAVQEHPIVGIGPGQFRPAKFAAANTPTLVTDNAGKSHLQILSMAAETGIPGALLFVGMLVWIAHRGWRSPLSLGAITFFALLSLAHDPLFQAPFSMALVGVLAAGVADARRATPEPSPS